MIRFTEEQVKSVLPYGAWRYAYPAGRTWYRDRLWPFASVQPAERLSPQQIVERLQVEPRECGGCSGFTHFGEPGKDTCTVCKGTGTIDPEAPLRLFVLGLLVSKCPGGCGGTGKCDSFMDGVGEYPCDTCTPYRQCIERMGGE